MYENLKELLIEAENEVKETAQYGANSYWLWYEVWRRDLLLELIEANKTK